MNEIRDMEKQAEITRGNLGGAPGRTFPRMGDEQGSEPIDLASLRYLNESAIKDFALQCSVERKNGKFTRVGADFIDEVKADVECILRELRAKNQSGFITTIIEPEADFVTGSMMTRVQRELNRLVGRIIQRKVERQPSCGKTLGRTR